MLVRIDGLGPLSAIFVYNDATCHVTRFQPPDWLLLHTSVSRGTSWDSHFNQFPANAA